MVIITSSYSFVDPFQIYLLLSYIFLDISSLFSLMAILEDGFLGVAGICLVIWTECCSLMYLLVEK